MLWLLFGSLSGVLMHPFNFDMSYVHGADIHCLLLFWLSGFSGVSVSRRKFDGGEQGVILDESSINTNGSGDLFFFVGRDFWVNLPLGPGLKCECD